MTAESDTRFICNKKFFITNIQKLENTTNIIARTEK